MSGFVFGGIAHQLNCSWTLDEPLPMDEAEMQFCAGWIIGTLARCTWSSV